MGGGEREAFVFAVESFEVIALRVAEGKGLSGDLRKACKYCEVAPCVPVLQGAATAGAGVAKGT